MRNRRAARKAEMRTSELRSQRVDGRTLSHATSAVLRRMAVRMVTRGARPSRVMARFGLCRTTIYRWLRAARVGGQEALASRPHLGRPPTVDDAGRARVRAWIIDHFPSDHGLSGALWTRRAVAQLVHERLGAPISPVAAGRLLVRIGLRPHPGATRPHGSEQRLLFAVDGRGSFLCAALPDSTPHTLQASMRRLASAAPRPVVHLLG
jgi:transposase